MKKTGGQGKKPSLKSPKQAPFDSPKKNWKKLILFTLTLSAFVFAVVVGVQILLGMIVVSLIPAEVLESPVVSVLFSIISYILAMVLIILVPPIFFEGKIKKSSRDSLGLRGLPTWTDLGLAPIGYIASIFIAAGITAVFNLFPWFNANEAQELGFSHYMVGAERVIAFLLLAVIAPIAEEIIFRGWLYGKLRIKIPKWIAILVTSLVFGLVHLQWNVGVTVFAMSIVACSMREITGTIYAGTLVHIVNNSVAFYLVYIVGTLG